jgi:hypothetical protein
MDKSSAKQGYFRGRICLWAIFTRFGWIIASVGPFLQLFDGFSKSFFFHNNYFCN